MGFQSVLLVSLATMIPFAFAALVAPHHAHLTQEASVGCSVGKALNVSYLSFILIKNSDTVDAIYTVNSSDHTQTSYSYFSTISGNITGVGSVIDPYIFTVPVDGVLSGQLSIPSGYPFVYLMDDSTVVVQVMVKSMYNPAFADQIIFPNDVLYSVSCNFSQVEDQLVNTNYFNVSGMVIESPIPVIVTAELKVVNSSSGQYLTEAFIGDSVHLEARANPDTLTRGTYVHSCNLCDTARCSGDINVPIIDSNGCSLVNYITKFTRQGSAAITGTFEAFVFSNTNKVYFQCMVNFCYSANQEECNDLCTLSVGRRKRDVSRSPVEPDQEITAALLITVDGQVTIAAGDEVIGQDNSIFFPSDAIGQSAEASQQDKAETTVLLYSVIALSALIVVGLVVATFIFYRLTKRNRKQ